MIRHILKVLLYRWYVIALTVFVVMVLLIEPANLGKRWEDSWSQTPPAIKAAVMRCGPNYQYRTLYNGTFQVNRGEGWERLRVWQDTGKTYDGHKIYRSILGHYALNISDDFLIELPEEAKKSVDNS